MTEGFLFSSKDGAFSFVKEVPNVFENAKTQRALKKSHLLKQGTEQL